MSDNSQQRQQNPKCIESFGNKTDNFFSTLYNRLGLFVGSKPRKTILIALVVTLCCCVGFMNWNTENRSDKLWVPQATIAEEETKIYETYFESTSRFNTIIVQSSVDGNNNVLTKECLVDAMKMHTEISTKQSITDQENYDLQDLCVKAGGTCISSSKNVCQCLITSILKQWNYNLTTLQDDDDYMTTLNQYGGSKKDLEAALGNPTFDENDVVQTAEAFSINYFLQDQSTVVNGNDEDPINENWESDVFLYVTQESVPSNYTSLQVDYAAARSFADEFGDAITGDLALVNISYVIALVFLGATLGRIRCGMGSRWSLALAALVMIILSTVCGFGLSSAFGLFFGPVHSILPFILLGIGVDDVFVIVNAFNRERMNTSRKSESNTDLSKRSGKSLARAGTSITITSLTDLVAFAISSSSALPALSSFCAYAAISIFFLWFFASTFFTASNVLDERRQRDNRRECLCCLTRKGGDTTTEEEEEEHDDNDDDDDDTYKEDWISRYFRNYHAPAILSKVGKIVVLLLFGGLFAFGVYCAFLLPVEDSERAFIPNDSYLADYLDAIDDYYPSRGIDVYFLFVNGNDKNNNSVYDSRQELADLGTERLMGLSEEPPYIAEPVNDEVYRNVMTGYYNYISTEGTSDIGNATLGEDGWPTTEQDFVDSLTLYASVFGPGAQYSQDIAFDEQGDIDAIRVQSEYVRLTKSNRGEIIDDADRQIKAMDETRSMVDGWSTDGLPNPSPYSPKFITIEGFKIIKQELFLNVGLAIAACGVIVFLTVASPMTAFLITLCVAFCIVDILGFMYALGIVIDSVSVINIVLAVGLSIDYSAHVGHCFMVKGGPNKNQRATEALADIGASVLNGALSTFLAVVVLLFSSSYVFRTLSTQFALTVVLGVAHGLVLLPVLLSICGPKAYASAEEPPTNDDTNNDEPETKKDIDDDKMNVTEPIDSSLHMDNVTPESSDKDSNSNSSPSVSDDEEESDDYEA